MVGEYCVQGGMCKLLVFTVILHYCDLISVACRSQLRSFGAPCMYLSGDSRGGDLTLAVLSPSYGFLHARASTSRYNAVLSAVCDFCLVQPKRQ